MRIIDRYLLNQFLKVFLICFFSLNGLFIVIDGFGNLEEFISFSSGKPGGLLAVMGDYYGYRSIYFFDRTSGILTLIAAMFTVSWIQRHNEMTALEAAGVSRGRVVLPVILAVVAISIASAANREIVIPAVRYKLSRSAQDLGGGTAKPMQPRYDNETLILLNGASTYSDKQRIHKPDFLLPAALNQYGTHVMAEDAFYQPRTVDRPGGYLFEGMEKPKNLDRSPSVYLGKRPVILTPQNAPWLKPGQCFVASDVSFEQLEGGVAWRQFSSTGDLILGLRNRSLNFGAEVRVAIHSRIVQPLLDVCLLFLGLPLVLARETRNMFFAIGLCLVVVVVFMLVVLGCGYLGSNAMMTPALSAWMPLLIFVPIAVGLSDPFRQ